MYIRVPVKPMVGSCLKKHVWDERGQLGRQESLRVTQPVLAEQPLLSDVPFHQLPAPKPSFESID